MSLGQARGGGGGGPLCRTTTTAFVTDPSSGKYAYGHGPLRQSSRCLPISYSDQAYRNLANDNYCSSNGGGGPNAHGTNDGVRALEGSTTASHFRDGNGATNTSDWNDWWASDAGFAPSNQAVPDGTTQSTG